MNPLQRALSWLLCQAGRHDMQPRLFRGIPVRVCERCELITLDGR